MKILGKIMMGVAMFTLIGWNVSAQEAGFEEAVAGAFGEKSKDEPAEKETADLSGEIIEAAVFEALGEKGSFTAFSARAIPAFKVPSIQNVETKALSLKFSEALWSLSEAYSEKDAAKYIMDKIQAFEPSHERNVIRQTLRDYLVRQKILDKSGGESELALSHEDFSTFKEDYVDDLKQAFSDREYGLAVAAAAQEEKLEKIALAVDREAAETEKGEERAEEKAGKASEKAAKAEEKADNKAVKAEKKSDKKSDEDEEKGDKKDDNKKK